MTGWKARPEAGPDGYIDDATSTVEARFYDHEGRCRLWIAFGWSSATGFPAVCI